MNRAPGERFTYTVEENDAGGRWRRWLVVQASNMGDGAFIVADADTATDAESVRDALQRVEGPPAIECAACAVAVDPLAVFPGGVCLECWQSVTHNGLTVEDCREGLRLAAGR